MLKVEISVRLRKTVDAPHLESTWRRMLSREGKAEKRAPFCQERGSESASDDVASDVAEQRCDDPNSEG